jgi:hypothetical protein
MRDLEAPRASSSSGTSSFVCLGVGLLVLAVAAFLALFEP